MALERYRSYLTVERGLGAKTACGYVDAVRLFLQGNVSPDGLVLDLGHLTATDVISFVVGRCPRQGHSAAKHTVTALRSLLGFFHVEGIIERSLAFAVPSVACRRLAGLPCPRDWMPTRSGALWNPATAAPRMAAATSRS